VWLFLTPLFDGLGYNLRWLALTVASYPLFLFLFAGSVTAPRRNGWQYALAMVGLSAALLPSYPSGLTYFVFGCVTLRLRDKLPLWRYLLVLESINLVFFGYASWLGYPWQAVAWLPVSTTVIGVIVHIERRIQSQNAELILSHEEVRRLAATAERERIGRDLHDLLGHTLSLITLKLELSRKLIERDLDAARRELLDAERIARTALAEVRSAVTGIRAADLAAELASARLLLESSSVALAYDPPPVDLAPDCERNLAWVLREAATNVARHANAASASVRFSVERDGVRMCVEDDGQGGIREDGNGLRGMRERVAAMGGTLSIGAASDNGGTRVLVSIPRHGAGDQATSLAASTRRHAS
jgi:two-component system sensor histidine kinase DesK